MIRRWNKQLIVRCSSLSTQIVSNTNKIQPMYMYERSFRWSCWKKTEWKMLYFVIRSVEGLAPFNTNATILFENVVNILLGCNWLLFLLSFAPFDLIRIEVVFSVFFISVIDLPALIDWSCTSDVGAIKIVRLHSLRPTLVGEWKYCCRFSFSHDKISCCLTAAFSIHFFYFLKIFCTSVLFLLSSKRVIVVHKFSFLVFSR